MPGSNPDAATLNFEQQQQMIIFLSLSFTRSYTSEPVVQPKYTSCFHSSCLSYCLSHLGVCLGLCVTEGLDLFRSSESQGISSCSHHIVFQCFLIPCFQNSQRVTNLKLLNVSNSVKSNSFGVCVCVWNSYKKCYHSSLEKCNDDLYAP